MTYDDAPPPYADQFQPRARAVSLTAAESQTARHRCCIPGCTRRGLYPAMLVARPGPTGAGGYTTFTTPHRVCNTHQEAPLLTADLVARHEEREPLRHWAALRYGWCADRIVFSASAMAGAAPAAPAR